MIDDSGESAQGFSVNGDKKTKSVYTLTSLNSVLRSSAILSSSKWDLHVIREHWVAIH